jgi:hypothetical protein
MVSQIPNLLYVYTAVDETTGAISFIDGDVPPAGHGAFAFTGTSKTLTYTSSTGALASVSDPLFSILSKTYDRITDRVLPSVADNFSLDFQAYLSTDASQLSCPPPNNQSSTEALYKSRSNMSMMVAV